MSTIADALLAVDARVAGSLASTEARRRVHHVAASIPSSSGVMLECHLGDPQRLDLAVRRERLEHGSSREADWRQVGWWCFDGDLPAGVYLGPGYLDSHEQKPPPRQGSTQLREWLVALDALAREERARVSQAAHEGIVRLSERLSGEETISYLGVLPRRDATAVRATVAGVRPAELEQWLARVGWPGDASEVSRALADGLAASSAPIVHLEVGETVHESLGVELRVGARAGARAWRALLDATLPASLRALAPAIEAWRGFELANDRWSPALRNGWAAAVRRVNHLKWSFRPGVGTTLKAYLYLGLIRPEELTR